MDLSAQFSGALAPKNWSSRSVHHHRDDLHHHEEFGAVIRSVLGQRADLPEMPELWRFVDGAIEGLWQPFIIIFGSHFDLLSVGARTL